MSEVADTEPPEDMSNMFATVWVKIEVDDDEETPLDLKDDVPDENGVMGNDQGELYPATETETSLSHTKLNKPTKLLYCNHCYYSGTSKKELRKHLATHNGKPFKCDQCNYTSKHQFTLQKHISKIHQAPENSQMYSCDMCEYKSRYKGNIILHQRKHSKEKKYKCDKCDYKTSYRNNYDKHANTHKDKVTYKCDKCNLETQFQGRLQRHLAQMHNEVFCSKHTCERCGFSNKEKWKLTKHIQRSETTSVLSCKFCDYTTNFKCEFKKHKHIHAVKHCIHQSALDKEKCEQCQAEAQTKMELQNHLKQAHNIVYKCIEMINMASDEVSNSKSTSAIEMGDEKYTGDVGEAKNVEDGQSNEGVNLEQSIADKYNWFNNFNEAATTAEMNASEEIISNPEITNLVNNMHKNKKIKSAKAVNNEFKHCQSNNYIIDTKCDAWHLIQVIKTDDSEKPFRCKLCDYNSKFKASVKRHYLRLHMGEMNRPYKCVNCDFSAKTKDKIALHNKRSASAEALTCKSCDFVTNFKCSLICHQKSHYKHNCNICSFTCRLKYDLSRHITTCHLSNSLKCQYCDFTVSRKDSMQTHESTHTG